MKKNIISRMKSKKARLAAGVLAVILGMFPGKVDAQLVDVRYATEVGWQNYSELNIWYGAAGYNNQNSSSTLPAYWFYDQSVSSSFQRMIWNYGGQIRVSTYQGEAGNWSNPRRVPTLGGHSYLYADEGSINSGRSTRVSTLTFQHYSDRDENGGVILVSNGDYGIYGERTNGVIYAFTVNSAGNGWQIYRSDLWDSYVYFNDNEAYNGGSIAVTNGSLNLLRVNFGDNRAMGTWNPGPNSNWDILSAANPVEDYLSYFLEGSGTMGLGGAIYNDQGGTVRLSNVHFGTNYFTPTYYEALDAASANNAYWNTYNPIYDTTYDLYYDGSLYQPGGSVYQQLYDKAYDQTNQNSAYMQAYNAAVAAGDNATQAAAKAEIAANAAFQLELIDTDNAAQSNANTIAHNAAVGPATIAYNDALNDPAEATKAASVAGNTAWRGGAIHNAGSIVQGSADWTGAAGSWRNSFTRNVATQFGGAIYNERSGTISIGAEFHENAALVSGGAVYNVGSFSLNSGSEFNDNVAVQVKGVNGATDDALGGAIFNDQEGIVTLYGTFLRRNFAGEIIVAGGNRYDGLGGGIYNKGRLNLNSVTFEQNKARRGGAIYNLGAINSNGSTAFQTNFAQEDGGAIYFEGGTSTFTDASFTRNEALRQGGAIYNNTATVSLTNSLFSYNKADTGGGAIINYYGNITLNAGRFTDNESRERGGAILNDTNKTFTIIDGTFERNHTTQVGGDPVTASGGAIYNKTGSMVLTDIVASENRAEAGYGGAIYNALNGSIILSSASKTNGFTKNTAILGGAIFNAQQAEFTLENVDFDQNIATQYGGAIYNDERGILTLDNGFFTTNTAVRGGAIYNNAGTKNDGLMALTNVQFLTNSATQYGGAIYNAQDAVLSINNGQFTQNSTIVSGGAIFNAAATFDAQGKVVKEGGVVTIENGEFNSNTAADAGAIANHAKLTIDTATFTDNKATALDDPATINIDEGGKGGAIFNAGDAYDSITGVITAEGGTLDVTKAIFRSNSAVYGGAIYNAQTAQAGTGENLTDLVNIVGSGFSQEEVRRNGGDFDKNTATQGGAVYNAVDGKLTISNAAFSWNVAEQGGGIFNNTGGVLTLTDVSFTDNTATTFDAAGIQRGGAIYNNSATLNLNVVNVDSRFGRFPGDATDNIYFVGADNLFNVDVAAGRSLTMSGGGMSSAANAEVEIVKTGEGSWILEGKGQFGTNAIVNFDLREGTLGMIKEAVLDLGDTGLLTTYEGSKINVGTALFALTPGLDTTELVVNEARIATNQLVVKGATEIIAAGFDLRGVNGADASEINFEYVTDPVNAAGAGPFLTLTHTTDPATAKAITVGSDIYVSMPNFTDNPSIILLETDGSFNGTSGLLFVDGAVQPSFERSQTVGDLLLGLAVTEDKKQVVLTMVDTNTKSYDLTWTGTGTPDNRWANFESSVKNWTGTVAGHAVDFFMNDDDVFFLDEYAPGMEVTQRDIVIGAGGVTVGSMTVSTEGDNYSFDVSNGSITAKNNIDFGTADFKNIVVGTEIAAGGTIAFAGENEFRFDLTGVNIDDPDAVLTLNAVDGVVGTVGNGDIYVSSVNLGIGEEIVLIDTGTEGTVVNTGSLYRNGILQDFERNSVTVTTVLGLLTDDDHTQLLLTLVSTDTASTDLKWTGAVPGGAWNESAANWSGTVGGHVVDTFLNGDTVLFADGVLNRTVNVMAGGVRVGDMNVTGSGYTFNLTNGGITALGNIDFGIGTGNKLQLSSGLAVSATGNIDFGNVTFGDNQRGIVRGTTISAGGTMGFGDENNFYFDLTGAGNGDNILTLNATDGFIGTLVNGGIYVYNTPDLGNEGTITLISAPNGTFTSTGTLYVNGERPEEFKRDPVSEATSLGLSIDDPTKLALTMVKASTPSTDLTWTGSNGNVWAHNAPEETNWTGTVGGHHVNMFLNGDTVRFTEDAERFSVRVAAGGVIVAGMKVDGSGYSFDLSEGGIESTGNIDFGTANVTGISGPNVIKAGQDITFVDGTLEFSGLATIDAGGDIDFAKTTLGSEYGSIVVGTKISADGTIAFDGNNAFHFDLDGAGQNDVFLTLDAGQVTGTIGNGDIFVWNSEGSELELDQSLVLVDVGTGNTGVVEATGTLYVDGKVYEFSRDSDEPIYGIFAEDTKLLLKLVQGGGASSNLHWTGAGNVWDVRNTPNWAGTVGGHFVDIFMDGDIVYFDNTYTDESGKTQFVNNKIVIIDEGGVKVGDMYVRGENGVTDPSGYTFDLSKGGITAQKDSITNATGSIDFGTETIVKGLGISADSTINAEGNITFRNNSTIEMTVGTSHDAALIVAGGTISLTNTNLNITGFNGEPNDAPITVIQAGSHVSGFNPSNVTFGGMETVDYATALASITDDRKTVQIEMTLSWYLNEADAHGDFTINGSDITIYTDLIEREINPDINEKWDGKSLTKMGEGTLVLAGNNVYSGATTIDGGTLILAGKNTIGDIEIIDGKLVAQNVDATGTGSIAIGGGNVFEVDATGTYTNVIKGGNDAQAVFGSSAGKLTIDADNSGFTGTATIKEGTVVRLEQINAAGKNDKNSGPVALESGSTLELGFGDTELKPDATKSATQQRNVEYEKQITGAGGVTVDGGLVVLANSANSYTGVTSITGGSTLIADNAAALGATSAVNFTGTGANVGAFTIGFGGTFDKIVNGNGDVYVNPVRNGEDTVILSGSSTYTGNTFVSEGVTVELANINGTGSNGLGTTVTLGDDATLKFTVGGDYYKKIVDTDGTGSVVKVGNGKLSLHNANTYGGGTTVRAGELVARHSGAVGSEAVSLEGGTFSVLIDAENDSNRFANEIVGTGNVKFGTTAGTLILDGAKHYLGDTTISQGTVRLTDRAATGENDEKYIVQIGEEPNVADANLILAFTGDYNKKVTGGGTLTIDSIGTVALTGTNTSFTGTVHLKNGTTELGNISALGSDRSKVVMENRTTLVFDEGIEGKIGSSFTLVDGTVNMDAADDVDVTLAGVIAGDASLYKYGEGTLRLSNASNSFASLNIKEGLLVAGHQDALGNGQIRNESVLELVVDQDVTLRSDIITQNGKFIKSGAGKLDMGTKYTPFQAQEFVMNGGSLEVQLSQGDKYYVQADTFTQTKSSEIIGTYNSSEGLARGSDKAVRLLALDGAGSNGFSDYTFNSNIARVNGQSVIDGDKLFFELWLDSFIDAYASGLSYNARQAAEAADRFAADNPLLNILTAYESEGGNMRKAFSSLHGEVYMSSIYATADLQRNFNDLLLKRRIGCEHCGEFKTLRGQYANTVQREVWATFTGGGNFRTKFDRFSGYNIGRWGVATGMEHNFSRNFFTGVAIGYDQANLNMTDLSQKDQFYAFRASAYGNITVDDISMFGQIGYSKNWHDVERKVDFLGENTKGKYNDDIITIGFDISKTYHVNNVNIIPSIGFNYVNLRTPFIEETRGGEAELFVRKQRYESFRVPLGVRTNSKFNIQGVDFMPEFRLFYVAELGDTRVRGITSFASDAGNTFLVDSGVRGSSSIRVGLGMQAQLFDFMSVGVDYDAEVWGKFTRHDVGGNVKLRW